MDFCSVKSHFSCQMFNSDTKWRNDSCHFQTSRRNCHCFYTLLSEPSHLSKDWMSPLSTLGSKEADCKINEVGDFRDTGTNVAGLKAEAQWMGCRRWIWRRMTTDRYSALLQRAPLHRLGQAVWQTLLLQTLDVLLCTGNATLGPAAYQLCLGWCFSFFPLG